MQGKHVVLIIIILLLCVTVYLVSVRKKEQYSLDVLSNLNPIQPLINALNPTNPSSPLKPIADKIASYINEIQSAADNAEYYKHIVTHNGERFAFYSPEKYLHYTINGYVPEFSKPIIGESFALPEPFGIIQDIQGAVVKVGDVVSQVTKLPGMAAGIVDTVKDKAQSAFDKVKGIGASIGEKVTNVVDDIKSVDYVGIAKDVGNKIQDAGEYVFDKVKDGAEFVYTNVRDGSKIAFNGVKSGLGTAYREIKSIGGTVGKTLRDGFDYVGGGLRDIGEKGIDMVKTIGEKTVGVFGTIIDTVKDILFAVIRIIKGLVQNAKDMGPFMNKYGKIFKWAIYILLGCVLLRSYFGLMYTLRGGVEGEIARFEKR